MQDNTCDSFFQLHASDMPKIKNNPDRESRIRNEAIVDCRPEELAMGWYYYLKDKISFPFEGKIRKNKDHTLKLSIPLETVTPVSANEETEETVLDWRYWRDKGYSFH